MLVKRLTQITCLLVLLLSSCLSFAPQAHAYDDAYQTQFARTLYVHEDYDPEAAPRDVGESMNQIMFEEDKIITYEFTEFSVDFCFDVKEYPEPSVDPDTQEIKADNLASAIKILDTGIEYQGQKYKKVDEFDYDKHQAYLDRKADVYGHHYERSDEVRLDTGFEMSMVFLQNHYIHTYLPFPSEKDAERSEVDPETLTEAQKQMDGVYPTVAYYLAPQLDASTGEITALGLKDKLVLSADGQTLTYLELDYEAGEVVEPISHE